MTRYFALLLAVGSLEAQAGRFEQLAAYKGLGALVASAVGPARPRQPALLPELPVHQQHHRRGRGRPGYGRVPGVPQSCPHRIRGALDVLGPTAGSTWDLDRRTFSRTGPPGGSLRDLGRRCHGAVHLGRGFRADVKLYGATYPQSKLVRYDPASAPWKTWAAWTRWSSTRITWPAVTTVSST